MKRQPRRAGLYLRISEDRFDTEAGVDRREADGYAGANVREWTIARVYRENDTSAWKRRKIKVNGRVVMRVIRPEFRQMLEDFQDGIIDGILVYDLDRLLRQNR